MAEQTARLEGLLSPVPFKAGIRPFARALPNMLVTSDPDWLIGAGRLVTALLAIIAIYLDPTKPAHYAPPAQIGLGLYVAFAILLVFVPLRRPIDDPRHLLVHIGDALAVGCLAKLTGGLASPFFTVLPFVLFATTLRWGLKGAMLGAAMLELVLVTVGWPIRTHGETDLNLFIMRSAYFLVAATLLGYLGAYRERSRQRLTELARWQWNEDIAEEAVWLNSLLTHAAQVLGAHRLIVIWRGHGEPSGTIAIWQNGRVDRRIVNDPAFWARHDPEIPAREAYATPQVQAADLLKYLAARSVPSDDAGPTSAAGFSTISYRGRVLVTGQADRLDEGQSLSEIIAARIGAELERAALLGQTASAARLEERARLAHDLHDSILQDLTAVGLRLRMIGDVAPAHARTHVADMARLIVDQQRRIRRFVDDQRFVDHDTGVRLSQTLGECAAALGRQWGCEVVLAIDPPDAESSHRIAHELIQLVSEATANAARHGHASRVWVDLAGAADGLSLTIADNGSGLPATVATRRPLSLSTRVAGLGGHLSISRPRPGLGLAISLPFELQVPP